MLVNLSKEAKEKISILRQSDNIVGLSGGKDSMATCIIMRHLDIPFRTITAEVWWKQGITGEHPRHYDFMHDKVAHNLESWGIAHEFISADTTAYQLMITPITRSKHPERVGKLRGFPLCGMCMIQRDCKMAPCKRYYKQQIAPFNVITGIAHDEPRRLETNRRKGHISILEILEINEFDAFQICRDENLLSPIYNFSDRNGCWFCPNQKIHELEVLYYEHRNLWEELMTIQRMPNKTQEKFNRTQTLYDIEKQINTAPGRPIPGRN